MGSKWWGRTSGEIVRSTRHRSVWWISGQLPSTMKFTVPFLTAAVCLASLAWYFANRKPIELPPGIAARHPKSFLISSK